MGGNALNKVIASRINLEQYNRVKKDLEEKFNQYLQLEFTLDVPGKIDFGDVDMLYMVKFTDSNEFDTSKLDIFQLISQIYNPVEIVSNGPVCSFAYCLNNLDGLNDEYFQVDLIKVENLPMSKFYFSYGDLGGIIGRMTQHKSITFGSKGLWVSPGKKTITKFLSGHQSDLDLDLDLKTDKEQIIKSILPNIILTNEPEQICKFIGLDWDKWVKGFENIQEIFEWVKKSKWFNSNSFRALDYEHRHRAISRPMYQEFLKYIFPDEQNFTIEKANSLNYINNNLQLESLEYFGKTHVLSNEIIGVKKRLVRKNKFSGKKFLDLGIESKQIKKFLEEFKLYIQNMSGMDFDAWLDVNNSEIIDGIINEFVNITIAKK
jgi:hypothetical protein